MIIVGRQRCVLAVAGHIRAPVMRLCKACGASAGMSTARGKAQTPRSLDELRELLARTPLPMRLTAVAHYSEVVSRLQSNGCHKLSVEC